jgi:hypothetical protein
MTNEFQIISLIFFWFKIIIFNRKVYNIIIIQNKYFLKLNLRNFHYYCDYYICKYIRKHAHTHTHTHTHVNIISIIFLFNIYNIIY